jgi:hypothetical protein
MPTTLDLARGADRDFLLQVRDAGGNAFDPATNHSPFDGTELLAGRVWQGDDLPTLTTPACAWSDATTGKFTLAATAAAEGALAVGTYRVQATATRGGKTGIILDGRLRVSPAPGTGTTGLAFVTLADLTTYCPWVQDVQDDREQFAFQKERVRATFRLIDDLVNQWDTYGLSPQAGQPGWNATTVGWGSLGTSPSKWLYDQLVPLGVSSTVPGEYPYRTATPANLYDATVSTALLLKSGVRECVARRALSYVFRAQVGRNADKEWWALARAFGREADAVYRATRFEVDLSNPQTGYASITVAGGWGSLR